MNKIPWNNKRLVMAIVNVTPDSFYEKSRCVNENQLLQRLDELKNEPVDIIDIGAYSSRPNGTFVAEQEEIDRLIPALKIVKTQFPETPISIDTFRAKVVAECAQHADFDIVNDISGGTLDAQMFDTVAELKKTYVLTHMRGTPQTMNLLENTTYNDLLQDVIAFFDERIQELNAKGVNDIIIDPGFGFAKTTEQNYTLLKNLHLFKKWNLPLLVGFSRKSMIYKTLKSTPQNSLNGTTVLNTLALAQGANILRVHDPREAHETVQLFETYNNA